MKNGFLLALLLLVAMTGTANAQTTKTLPDCATLTNLIQKGDCYSAQGNWKDAYTTYQSASEDPEYSIGLGVDRSKPDIVSAYLSYRTAVAAKAMKDFHSYGLFIKTAYETMQSQQAYVHVMGGTTMAPWLVADITKEYQVAQKQLDFNEYDVCEDNTYDVGNDHWETKWYCGSDGVPYRSVTYLNGNVYSNYESH